MYAAKNTLAQISSAASLQKAWERLLTNSRPNSRWTLGQDERCINDYRVDPRGFLLSVGADLRAGKYKFSPLVPHLLPKPNGKKRLICVPTVSDRVVQRALLNFLTVKYRAKYANEISYGFIEGRSVQDAATVACSLRAQHGWVFKTDIASFFDRLDRSRLAEQIKKQVRDRSLHALLISASSCEIAVPESPTKRTDIAALGITHGLGVRQGMPLSPFFANLFLNDFDKVMIVAGFHAVRYADDLIFFADNEAECHAAHEFCSRTLKDIGLEIPPVAPGSKSQILPPHVTAEFLGLGLRPNGARYELVLTSDQISAIRQEILVLGSVERLLSREIHIGNLVRHIQAKISGYRHAYRCCTNAAELENSLDDMQQSVLRQIYRDLGIDVERLSGSHRTFLDLRPAGVPLGLVQVVSGKQAA